MPRFDALHKIQVISNRILIMPTWRYWFNLKSKRNKNTDNDFETSEYVRCWEELLVSPELERLINKCQLEVIFYPHRNMQNYIKTFEQLKTSVVIASWEKYDIQELLKSSAIMITDYSSVFFDMIYMKSRLYSINLMRKSIGNINMAKGTLIIIIMHSETPTLLQIW